MLMVVFGAGASYDSFAAAPPGTQTFGSFPYQTIPVVNRPPLANELFDWRFADTIARFPQFSDIIQYLQRKGSNVESQLETFNNEASEYPRRKTQLAAIRYYLQSMLWACQNNWGAVTKGVTNYKTLLDQIAHRRRPEDKICLVTFNYDTLLEDALRLHHVRLDTIPDYIASDYQLIKLHGSINWALEVETEIRRLDARSQDDIARELIERAGELKIRQSYRIIGEYPIAKSNSSPWIPLFPALAIPLETKQPDTCPPDHLRLITKNLPQVTKLMIIGWRASDKPFLQSLARGLQRDARTLVVSSSVEGANQTIARLREAGVEADFLPATGGFSHVVLTHETDKFLQS